MPTIFPSSIDTLLTLPKVYDGISPILADDVNRLRDAIVAIESELGTSPSGTFITVKERLDSLRDGYYAENIVVYDIDGYYDTSNVESVLIEIGRELDLIRQDISDLIASPSIVIGAAEDGSYEDGLFADFTSSTPIGTAVDRFNEVLKELAPPPAPDLSDIGFSTANGPSGNVSFGASNAIVGYTDVGTAGGGSALDINGTFTAGSGSSLRRGIFASGGSKTGIVADAVVADDGSPTPSYPANAFSDGYSGSLQLEVNGSVVHEIDLTTFGTGSSLNGNGSGFQNVSAGTYVSFPNGSLFPVFVYRTADWIVGASDQIDGWNYMRVIHNNSPSFTRSTNYFEWVQDGYTTATTFSAESLSGLSMTGSKYISGVQYYTGGTASYGITVHSIHANTYSTSASAISHGASTGVSISSSSLGTISSEADTEVISKTATINSTRLLDASITAKTTADRTVQTDETSSGASISGILMDNVTDSATNTNEPLNGELYRVASNKALTDTTGYNSGGNDSLWDQTLSLTSGGAGYNDGLLMYNGLLYYPNNASVANSGNFSTITNGPGGNPDYSAATGARVYWRYFYFASATSNFILRLNATATVVDAGTVSSSSDEISVEFLLPNTTVDGGATVEFKDANVAYTSDTAIGCYASTYGANGGSTAGSDWGISFGTKSTATSGNAVVIRITAGQGWTGNISNIEFVSA